jgi:hypothetical protein
VQFVQDKCDLLNSFQVGEAVKIDINLRGREWTRSRRNGLFQYYSRLENCKIKLSASAGQAPPMPAVASLHLRQILMRKNQTILPFNSKQNINKFKTPK